ncbi:MAG: hypothetical protein JKY54_10815 [Flavobacteriales bacterium]|nr:hypothetical protein [Flavobacteriales bacterium]
MKIVLVILVFLFCSTTKLTIAQSSPLASFAGKTAGHVYSGSAIKVQELKVENCTGCIISNFALTIIKDGDYLTLNSTSAKLTDRMRLLIGELKKEQVMYFDLIHFIDTNGIEKIVPEFELKIW